MAHVVVSITAFAVVAMLFGIMIVDYRATTFDLEEWESEEE